MHFSKKTPHELFFCFRNHAATVVIVLLLAIAVSCGKQGPATKVANDSARQKGISLLTEADSLHDLDKQEELAKRALSIGSETGDDSLKFAALLQLGYYKLTRQDDTSQVLLWQARNGFRRLGIGTKVLRADAALLNYYTKSSQYDKATERILEAEQLAKNFGKPNDDLVYYYLQKTVFYHNLGFPDSALNVVNRAETIRENSGSDRYKPNLAAMRAVIYTVFGDNRKAVSSYLSVIDDFDDNTSDKAIVYTNLGNQYARLRQVDSAEYYYTRALRTYQAMNIGNAVIHKLHNNAALSLIDTDREAARKHFIQVSPGKLNLPNQFYHAYIRAMLEPDRESVIRRLNDALDFAETNRIPLKDLEKDIHYDLYERYQEKGNTALALEHFRKATELNEAIRGEETALKIEQLNIMSNTREKETKIVNQEEMLIQKNKTIRSQRINNWLLTALMFITAAILILLLLNYRKRMRISALLLSQTRLERELLISEVSPIAVQIEKAADIIRDLREKVSSIEKQVPGTRIQNIKGAMQEWLQGYNEQSTMLEAQKNAERDFLRKVDGFDQLTATEKRVVILIRQGLQSKEIAARLHLALNTVEIYRSKIRRKMNVPAGEGLTEFIKSL